MKITMFSIKRSGPAMTIDGVDQETGRPIKVTSVTRIDTDKDHRIVAVTDEKLYELVP